MRSALLILTVVVAIGAVLTISAITGRCPPLPGRLPGDLRLESTSGTFFFPFTTCLLVSVVLTCILNVLLRWWRWGR